MNEHNVVSRGFSKPHQALPSSASLAFLKHTPLLSQDCTLLRRVRCRDLQAFPYVQAPSQDPFLCAGKACAELQKNKPI